VFNYFLIAMAARTLSPRTGIAPRRSEGTEAAIKALVYPATAYKEGFVPPGAITGRRRRQQRLPRQTDPCGFTHDLDEVAVHPQGKKADYDDIVTMGLALSNDGKPVPSNATNTLRPNPERCKKRRGGEDFLKYLASQGQQRMLKTGPAAIFRCISGWS